MARFPRITYYGAVYHIYARGNNKNNIFFSDEDKITFLRLLCTVVSRYNWLCHAYCLMSNHFHLLIETPDGNVSEGMHLLNGVYTQKFNRCHSHTGHVFQGRFHSVLVQKESQLLELCRYVVLNPVRAGIVSSPEDWKWSSYLATIEKAKKPDLLCIEWILGQFHPNKSCAQKKYIKFVQDGMNRHPSNNKPLGGALLGDLDFFETVSVSSKNENLVKYVERVKRLAARPPLIKVLENIKLKNRRNEKIFDAHYKYGYSLTEIAKFLEVHCSTVSRAIKRYQKEKSENAKFKA